MDEQTKKYRRIYRVDPDTGKETLAEWKDIRRKDLFRVEPFDADDAKNVSGRVRLALGNCYVNDKGIRTINCTDSGDSIAWIRMEEDDKVFALMKDA